jgi:hypothetical protein
MFFSLFSRVPRRRSACLRCRMAAHSCHGCSYQLDEYAAVRMRRVARVFVDIHSSGDERLSVSRTHTLLIEPSSHCFTACLDDAAVRVHPKPTCQHYASTRWPRPGGWPATAGTACHSCPRPNTCEGHACHMGCGGLSVECIAHCM